MAGGIYSHDFDEAFNEKIHRWASDIYFRGEYIATLCVGILHIADSGPLKGKQVTTYPYRHNI